jgi:hypothetical protein
MSTGPIYSYNSVPIHAVYAERAVYNTYPSCQRDYVWTAGMQQKLIDSVLRGLPIPAITVLPASNHELMGVRYWVVDGQQRLKTIIKFREGEFKTGTSFSLEPGQKPVEPGSFYDELSPNARSAFDFYSLQICFVKGVEPQDTGLIYRRFNYQVALKFAEVLYSYESKAKQLVESLYDNIFWKTVYSGNSDRKQIFIMGMHILFMEVMDIFANMTSPRLAEMAKGSKDHELNPQLREKIEHTLNGLSHIFYGVSFNSIGEIIPLYQAGLLLEDDGYDMMKSQRGCLAPWYMKFREHATNSRREGISNPIGVLNNVNRQREFWINNLNYLYQNEGLFRKDKKRDFNDLDKLKAWLRQSGKCLVCGKSVRITDVGHHLKPHAEGGMSQDENCALLHQECHTTLHNNPQLPLLTFPSLNEI